MATWDTVKSFWGLAGDPPVTDATTANDDLVEDKINRIQACIREFTDAVAEVSAERTEVKDLLQKYRDGVVVAYVALIDGKYEEAKKELQRLVNK